MLLSDETFKRTVDQAKQKNVNSHIETTKDNNIGFTFINVQDKLKLLNEINFKTNLLEDIGLNYDFDDGADLRTARHEYLLKTAIDKEEGREVKDNMCQGIMLMLLNGVVASSSSIGLKYIYMWDENLDVFE